MTEPVDVDATLPGDPEAVDLLAGHLERAAAALGGAAERIAALRAPGTIWEGPAAEAFLEHVFLLSSRVSALEEDLRAAATALTSWRDALADRRRQLVSLREELGAAQSSDPGADAGDGSQQAAESDRLRARITALADEHEEAGAVLAHTLRRCAEAAGDPAGSIDGTAWLTHAETLLHQLDDQVAGWVSAQGPALSATVSAVSETTALGTTVSQAAVPLTPDLGVALAAAVAAVAAGSPASHRLISAARHAQQPIPLESLPRATFATRAVQPG